MADLEEEARRRRERLKAMLAQMESGEPNETSDGSRLSTVLMDDVAPSTKRSRIADTDRSSPDTTDTMAFNSDDRDNTTDHSSTNGAVNASSASFETAVFKSYIPDDAELEAELKRRQPKPPDITPLIQEHLDAAKGEVLNQNEDLSISQLAPQKIDWDLKRDVAKKLARLELRTKRIIAEIVQERELARREGVTEEVET